MHPDILKFWQKFNRPITEKPYPNYKYFDICIDDHSNMIRTLAIFDLAREIKSYYWWPDILEDVSSCKEMSEKELLRMIKLEPFA